MPRSLKLVLDLLMGAVLPILVLSTLTGRLGAPVAYVVAALIPVGWVLIDLLFITRQFNAITVVAGLTALSTGVLAFWFVDGVLFAFKDSVGLLSYTALLGGSVIIGRPFLRPLFAQTAGAMTLEQRHLLDPVLNEPPVARALKRGTLGVAAMTTVLAAANFALNLAVVTAAFGTEEFNQQVAQVNAITRLAFPLATMAAFGVAIWTVYRALFITLAVPMDGRPWYETDIWQLLRERDAGGVAANQNEAVVS